MKKILILTLILLLSLALASCGSSDEKDGTLDHTHAYGEWSVSVAPGCDTVGEEKRVCTCGEAETREIAALGHVEIILDAKEPTCSEDGCTEGKACSECGTTIVHQTPITKLPHKEETIPAVAPDCENSGLTEGVKCSDCGETIVAQEVIPPAHSPETVPGKSATCYEEGLTDGSRCSECGNTIVAQQIIPITHNVEIIEAVEPGCYNTGLTEGKWCPDCGEVILPQETIDRKHSPEVVEGYAPPDCFTHGYRDGVSCSLCGEVITEREIIEPTHDAELVPGYIATCTKTGLTDGLVCVRCGNTLLLQKEIPFSLHNFVDGHCTHCEITEFSQGLLYELSADGQSYTVKGRGTCKDLKIIIPDYYLGKPVKEIAAYAFSGDCSILSVVIPSTVEHIGQDAFSYAERLVEIYNLSTYINLNSTTDKTGLTGQNESYVSIRVIHTQLDEESVLKVYGDYIFAEINTPKLIAYLGDDVRITLPEDYNGEKYEIYRRAFYKYKRLVSIVVPKNVTDVGLSAFDSCTSLVEVYNLAGFQLEFNGSWLEGELGRYAYAVHSSADAESIVDIVGDFAFVTADGENYLVAYLGNGTEIVLPENYKGETYTVNKLAFANVTSIVSVRISSGVKAIGDQAFASCTSLREVVFDEGVTSIGYRAFTETAVRRIVLPNSLTYLGTYSFAGCESLGYLVINEGLETISNGAFSRCHNLASITLPKSLKTIESGAFAVQPSSEGGFSNGRVRPREIINHSSLALTAGSDGNGSIAFGKDTIIYNGESAVSTAVIKDDFLFLSVSGSYYLAVYLGTDKEITLPSDINGNTYEIMKNAFSKREDLISVTIPEGVTAIGYYSFGGCTYLTTVNVAGSVKVIGEYAFSDCVNLVNVNLEDGLEKISKYAFSYCQNLETITIPASVTYIGGYCFCPNAFTGESKLTSVIFEDTRNWYSKASDTATREIKRDAADSQNNASIFKGSSKDYIWIKK